MDVVEEKENKLFDRKEVVVDIDNTAGTVSRSHVLQELKHKFHGEIVILKVTQRFGSKKAVVTARVYASKENAEKFEPKWRMARGTPKEKKAEGAEQKK